MKTSILQNILLVAAGGLAAGLANGEAETPDYGNYVCLVQRTVGFEGGFKDKPPICWENTTARTSELFDENIKN